ncbi:MAG: hypothetical protein R3297_06035, partial [Desulfobulbales bacterium]|nr:hypothetical protein [Desulfobulbales bacterium]
MWDLEVVHDILIEGSDFASCKQRVGSFFDRTMLIRYDSVVIVKNESVNGSDQTFWTRIQEGLTANKHSMKKLLENLKEEGFASIDDLQSLEQGYLSKILHTIAHLKDGFVGVDSRFYNLVEDSHSITRGLLQKLIEAT